LDASIRRVKHARIAELASLGSGDPVPSKEFIPVGIPLVRNRDIGPGGFWSTETAVSAEYAKSASRYSAGAGLVLVAMDGEFRAQFALDLELPLHVNQRIATLVARGIRPELLTAWLNRVEGQHQLNRWAVKTTVEHTSLDHIGAVLVPRLDEDEEDALADRLLLARHADWYVRSLTLAAESLVEQLIDGRVTEAVLVAAQKAFESGDRNADREILIALRRSDAPDAKPLIADVDALYALLDALEGQDA
jgi:type I restriction enzyme, S subunit